MTGMHHLRQVVRVNGEHVGEVIPLTLIRSPAHLILQFGAEANPRLTRSSSCELSTEFWLNKYWSKEFYLVFRSPVGNWYKDWQLDWTATDCNWTAVASCDEL